MGDCKFSESGFCFDFSSCRDAYVADVPSYHGLSAVDFIVETDDRYIFIEVKNPDNKKALQKSKDRFLKELELKDFPLRMASKFKDSLLKELAQGKIFNKPITYVLFLEFSIFDAAQKRKLFERIQGHVPGFKEHEIFKSLSGIRFLLLDKREFENIFPEFRVIELD